MSWDTSSRRERLPRDWPLRRSVVLRRDGFACRIRGPRCIGRASEADHITPGDDHSLGNLRAACRPCHSAKSSREGNEAKRRLREQAKRPAPRHPGLKTPVPPRRRPP